jgi:hypothetical protein
MQMTVGAELGASESWLTETLDFISTRLSQPRMGVMSALRLALGRHTERSHWSLELTYSGGFYNDPPNNSRGYGSWIRWRTGVKCRVLLLRVTFVGPLTLQRHP